MMSAFPDVDLVPDPLLPDMDIVWVKGEGKIDFKRPSIFFNLGMKGSGKSSLLELFGSKYIENGGKVMDLFGARDGEGLAWLRSPYATGREICLLHGHDIKITGWNNSMLASNFTLEDLDTADIFVSASPLYNSIDEEFSAVNKIIDRLWNRMSWKIPVCLIVREAANLIYSRIKLTRNQNMAKNELIYLIRESRHCGLGLALDTTKFSSIDFDVRTLVDFLPIKNLGMWSLPDDLMWVYKTFDPESMRRMDPDEFIILDKAGHLGVGTFTMPSWHKQEYENIIEALNLKIERTPRREGHVAIAHIDEALSALRGDKTCSDVTAWIAKERGATVNPHLVGSLLGELGYCTKLMSKEGRVKKYIIKSTEM